MYRLLLLQPWPIRCPLRQSPLQYVDTFRTLRESTAAAPRWPFPGASPVPCGKPFGGFGTPGIGRDRRKKDGVVSIQARRKAGRCYQAGGGHPAADASYTPRYYSPIIDATIRTSFQPKGGSETRRVHGGRPADRLGRQSIASRWPGSRPQLPLSA